MGNEVATGMTINTVNALVVSLPSKMELEAMPKTLENMARSIQAVEHFLGDDGQKGTGLQRHIQRAVNIGVKLENAKIESGEDADGTVIGKNQKVAKKTAQAIENLKRAFKAYVEMLEADKKLKAQSGK